MNAPWAPSLPAAGRATPADLADLVWDYLSWDHAHDQAEWIVPGSRAELDHLVHAAYRASLRSEERRPVLLQLVYDRTPAQATLRFGAPLDCAVAELVRLSPTTGIGGRWLVVNPDGAGQGGLRIVGLCDHFLSPHPTRAGLLTRWVEGMGLHLPEVTGLSLSTFAPGWLRVCTSAQRFFELRDGTIRLPFTLHDLEPVGRFYDQAARGLAAADPAIARALLRRLWGGVASAVRDSRHGGTFLIVPAGLAAPSLPLKRLCRLDSLRLRAVLAAHLEVEPELVSHVQGKDDIGLAALERAHFLERDLGRAVDLLAALAAVDGAVVLDRELRLLGFGAEILLPDGEAATGPSPVASFGMRHRSAYRFCQGVTGTLALVVSQDGDLRVFSAEPAGVELYDGPTPEDWVLAPGGEGMA